MTEEEKIRQFLGAQDPTDPRDPNDLDLLVGYPDVQNQPIDFAPNEIVPSLNKPTESVPSFDSTAWQRPNLNDDDDRETKKQRLLAYLGMGAQDAITGMTGFKGNTNVYDQMLLVERQKKRDELSKQDRINNYLRQKNTFDNNNRRFDELKKQGEEKKESRGESNKLREQEIAIKKGDLTLRGKALDQKGEIAEQKAAVLDAKRDPVDVAASKKTLLDLKDWDLSGDDNATAAIKTIDDAIEQLKAEPDIAGNRTYGLMSQSGNALIQAQAKRTYAKQYALTRSIQQDALPMLGEVFRGAISDSEREFFLKSKVDLSLPPKQVIAELEKTSAKAKTAQKKSRGLYNSFRKSGSLFEASKEMAPPEKEVIPQAPKIPSNWNFKEIK